MIQPDEEIESRRRYVRKIARAIARGDRVLADDLEQDAMLVALTSSPEDPGVWRGWLRAVTRNTLRYQRFRQAQMPLHTALPSEAEEPSLPSSVDPQETVAATELNGKLGELMGSLPAIYRDVVQLRVLEELPPREVAKRLGITPETVRTRHRRGLAMLREDAERTLGADSLPSWRGWFAFALTALRRKPRLAALAAGVPLAVGGLFLLSERTAPDVERVGFIEPPKSTQMVVGDLAGGGRAPAPTFASASTATVAVAVEDESGVALPDRSITLRGPDGETLESRSDELGRVDRLDLEPGRWAAWDGGDWLGARDFEAGQHDWTLVIEAEKALTIEVTDNAGAQVAGAEVYLQKGLDGPVERVGVTDKDGHLQARVPRLDTWIAARGEPGMISRTLFVDQPSIPAADGKLHLVLNDLAMSWHAVELDDELIQRGVTLRGMRPNPRGYTVYSLRWGMMRESSWLPAWIGEDGRYGITEGNNLMLQASDDAGRSLWVSDLGKRGAPLAEQHVARRPIQVSGRLLDAAGGPAGGQLIQIMLKGRGIAPVAEGLTGSDGRFVFDDCPATDLQVFGPQGPIATVEPFGREAQGSELPEAFDVGDLQFCESEFSLRLSAVDHDWRVQLLRRPSSSLPEVLREIGGRVLAQRSLAAGATSLDFESAVATRVGSVLFEGDTPEGKVMHLEVRPGSAWGTRAHYVSLEGRAACFATARIDPVRLPVQARWIEARSGLCQPAYVDGATGEIGSPALPAGDWALHLLDRNGVNQSSKLRTIAAGETGSFGLMVERMATVRVHVPMEAHTNDRVLAAFRVTSLCGSTAESVFIHRDEPLPPFVELEIPPLEYMVTLALDHGTCVGYVNAEGGQSHDVELSSSDFILRLTGITKELALDPGMTVGIYDRHRVAYGERAELASALSARGEIELIMPRKEGGVIVLKNSSGEVHHARPVEVNSLGFQRVDL